ncbi:MAG: metallophosphoesterase [Chloroflexi bacterium]|nr:metallophosphoesterase [Chloroflexota bacterium]
MRAEQTFGTRRFDPRFAHRRLSRRRMLKALAGGVIASAAAAAAGYGYISHIEPRWLQVERVRIPIPHLPEALEGLRIVQLSDIHLYPYTDLDLARQAVSLAAAQRPDLVALTGDFVLKSAEAIDDLAPVLAQLNPRLGIYAVLGNHEMWLDPAPVMAGLARFSIPTLINRGLHLGVGGASLYVAGLDDGWSGHPDLSLALAGRPADAVTLLMAHEPDLADETVRDGRVHLQLSGHSHGGQVRLPGVGALLLPFMARKYDQGLYRLTSGSGGLWLYTNRGIGVNNPPVRFGCRPEVTLFTLMHQVPGSEVPPGQSAPAS